MGVSGVTRRSKMFVPAPQAKRETIAICRAGTPLQPRRGNGKGEVISKILNLYGRKRFRARECNE